MALWTWRGGLPSSADGGPARSTRTGSVDVPVLAEEHHGLWLLWSSLDDTFTPADIGSLGRDMPSGEGVVTLVAAAPTMAVTAFWPRLSEVLDRLCASGTTAVRLVMAEAGREYPERPALARRIADSWGVTVDAPVGTVMMVPGGSLFIPIASGSRDGWRRFFPRAKPAVLGPRSPVPPWQGALSDVPTSTAGGCVVEQLPAGLIVRPAEARAPRPGDLYYSVPMDPRRPTIVVGVAGGEDVSVAEVVSVLAAMPESVRSGVQLAPGGLQDLLRLGQGVADQLGAEVEVSTGLPLVAAGRQNAHITRSALIGRDGTPSWLPFVDAVVCRPSLGAEHAPSPRLLRWSPPVPGPGRLEDGVVRLDERWQVAVTRAGLWVSARDAVPLPHRAREVSAEGPAIEVGVPGVQLDDSLWPVLSQLLVALDPGLRACATLYVHGTCSDGGSGLRGLAARHGLRTIRYAATPSGPRTVPPPGPGPAPGPRPTPRPVLTDRPGQTPQPGPVPRPPAGVPATGRAVKPPVPGRSPVPRRSTASDGTPARTPAVAHGPRPVPAPPVTRLPAERTAQRPDADAEGPSDPPPGFLPVADLDAAWEHLSRGRRGGARSKELPSGLSEGGQEPGPDLDAAWEYMSRGRTAAAAEQDEWAAASPHDRPRPHSAPGGLETAPGRPPASSRPLRAGHRSSDGERSALRMLAGPVWERHAPAVAQALTRLTGLPDEEHDAARADVTALRMYLAEAEGPLGHRALTHALRTGDARLQPYAACLLSGLRRMPTYRGAVLRGAGAVMDDVGLLPGSVLCDRAPVSGVLAARETAVPLGPRYAVWSVTGRRVRQVLPADGEGEIDGGGGEELVFPLGTPFRVLGVRLGGAAPVVLLRELPASPAHATGVRLEEPDELDDTDRTALAALDEALKGRSSQTGKGGWLERCAGPIGNGP